MLRKVLTIGTCLLSLTHAQAQIGRHFDAAKQMSSSFTNQVYVDRDGFVWAATRNGLNRYDGYQYQILKKEKGKDNGMASNYVNCMLQDHNGLFYIGMWGALQTYNGERFETIKTYDLQGHEQPCYITSLLLRNNGDILIGTSGHGVMRLTDRKTARQMGGVLSGISTVSRMAEDLQQRLWMTTEHQGLICFDGKTVTRYFDSSQLRSSLSDVCVDRDGVLYVGTTSDGLFRMYGSKPVQIAGTAGKHVASIFASDDGRLFIGYDGSGVAIYNPRSGQLTTHPYYSSDVDLSTTKVFSITEDTHGNLWLGLMQKGVFMHPSNTSPFDYLGYKIGTRNTIGTACVTSVLIDSNGKGWIGTDKDGLYCLNTDKQVVRHFKERFPATILSLAEDQQGRIWTGSYKEGCGWIDTRTMTYHPYQLPQGEDISVFDIVCDNEELWLGTMGYGLLRLQTKTGSVKAYTTVEGAADNRLDNHIINDYIAQISLSPDGKRIYVATTMGVCAMEIATENWLSTFNGKNCPNYGTSTRIAREFSGKLRIGTYDGLYSYDLRKHQLERHGIESGLPDNGIASIEEDKKLRLWITTDHGLACVDPRTRLVSCYYADDGLQSNEYSDGASWITQDGNIIFGGQAGVSWFHPDNLKQQEWKGTVKLTSFTVNGEPVAKGTMSGLWHVVDTTVIAANRFVLSHSDNNFALQFSTLTYDNPDHIVYRYSINGEPWVRMLPGVNEITFSHLAPGEYNFCVIAEHNNISTPERCFTVVIHAPWYRTPLAYLIYILLIAAVVYRYLKNRQRKEQDRMRLQEYIHAEEMADAKLRFFINISHEIRTPMTLIVTPLQSLIKQDQDPQRSSIYHTICRNAERILSLINQMMDLRKIDKGQMQMHMCETDLISFVNDIYALFAPQAKAKSILLSYEHDAEQLPVWIDRSNFDKIVMNILSNAFKFTPSGGAVSICVTHDDKLAHIAVKDSGEGIPQDKLPHIFERFYQAPSHINDRNTGTGIGLDLTRALVELHHGTIEAHNNVDEKGCEFIVSIPLGHEHLKEEEILQDDQEGIQEHPLIDEIATSTLEQPSEKAELSKFNQRGKLVIAEDDGEIRDFLVSELGTEYDITACTNGKEGLSAVLTTLPDLVISDIMMPEMDGNTLCSTIKANAATNHIPVILLTAKSRDEDQLEGLETGADAYIVKPFNMDILRRTIVNLIRSHRMLQLKYGRNDQLEDLVDDIQVKSPNEKLLERVMAVINNNLDNSDLSVDRIADEVGISRVHLHRKMKELTGQTPHDFIRNIRMKKAASLLAMGDKNVSEVIYACGFSSPASFSTVFKKTYGVSPREYMNEHHARKKSSEEPQAS